MILSVLGCRDVELSILLTDEQEIADLNRTYRGVDEPTDVLSFPMDDLGHLDIGMPRMLGDVVISVQTAKTMAEKFGVFLELVMDVLLVHGVLHLLGYDHDDPKDAIEMDEKTLEILKYLGYPHQSVEWYKTESWYE